MQVSANVLPCLRDAAFDNSPAAGLLSSDHDAVGHEQPHASGRLRDYCNCSTVMKRSYDPPEPNAA